MIEKNAICVDASCIDNPGKMEYRGVDLHTKKILFTSKIYPVGTNNIGEFLAIIDALKYINKTNKQKYECIYSDSQTAIARVKSKKIKTTLAYGPQTKDLLEDLNQAIIRLKTHTFTTKILKRETEIRGQIPADFGRK